MTVFCLRPATPTDAGTFADLAVLTSPAMPPPLTALHDKALLRKLFCRPGNLSSYDKSYLVTVSGQPAGLILGFTWQQQRREKLTTYWHYAKHLKWRTLFISLILAGGPRWMGRAAKGEYYISYLAVYPRYRRQGLGRILLCYAEALARQANCSALCLTVNSGNEAAISLYRQLGYQIERVGSLSLFQPNLGRIYRMRKTIEIKLPTPKT